MTTSINQFVIFLCIVCAMVSATDIKTSLDNEIANPCVTDIQTICGMPFPDSFRAIYDARFCLKGSSEVSAECVEFLHSANPSIVEPCFNEIKTLCADIVPGGNRIHDCLSQNPTLVSAECSSAAAQPWWLY